MSQSHFGWAVSSRRSLTVAVLTLAPLVGCSSIPAAETLPAPSGPATEFRLGVPAVPVGFARSERPKGYAVNEVVTPRGLAEAVARWTAARGRYRRVQVVDGAGEARLAGAWAAGHDLLLEVDVSGLKTTFDGHNEWWIPNIANWLFWIIPSFFVATEEYSLTCEAEARLVSVDSRQIVMRERFTVSAQGTFDEFDRGWQPLGFLTPLNDADNWRQIASKLFPAVRSRLAGKVSEWASSSKVLDRLDSPDGRRRRRKTMALVIGISEYPDPVRLPRLPFAASDARSVAAALLDPRGTRLSPRHVIQLLDANATVAELGRAFTKLEARMRREDQLLVYVAGYGARAQDGRRVLMLHGGAGAPDQYPLDTLAAALAKLPCAKLVLLDVGFDGRGRSVGSQGSGGTKDAGLAALTQTSTVILGTSAGGHLLTPPHIRGSLFAHHLVRGLRGAADRNRDGQLSPTELFELARSRVVAQAAYLGKRQEPRALGLGRSFMIRAGRLEETK